MASKMEGDNLQGLICPMCLDVFNNATLLCCGHTFCKECLEAYDEHHDDLDHIDCPVCRQTTELGQRRVEGLTPNFLASGIQDELHLVAPSQSFCPSHSKVHNDIFCENCTKFICLTCYLHNHKDHIIKKQEELGGYLKEKTDSLIHKGNMRKAEVEKCVENAQQEDLDIHSHLSNVEKEIKDEFTKRVSILRKNEEALLKKLDDIRKDTKNQLEVYIANQRKGIDHINRSITILKSYTDNNLDIADTIKAQHSHCSDLEKSLKNILDETYTVRLKQTAGSTRFRPSDEKLLALGHVELGMKETKSFIERVKTAAGVNKKAEKVPVESKSLTIVRNVHVTNYISGMAALSQDAVVVGYGGYRHGADYISVLGEKKQHLKSEVGAVYDISILTDGIAVSHDSDAFSVYTTQDTGRKYTCTCKKGEYVLKLCSDQGDNICAVNGKSEIYISRDSNHKHHKIVNTGDIRPRQVCITKKGVMITSTCDITPSTVTVFAKKGRVGSSLIASDVNEYLYAAVDSQDRVLVARVRGGSDVFRLTRYTLQGKTIIQERTFQELKLHTYEYCWAYMTSLTGTLLAFANTNHLYFIELDV